MSEVFDIIVAGLLFGAIVWFVVKLPQWIIELCQCV